MKDLIGDARRKESRSGPGPHLPGGFANHKACQECLNAADWHGLVR